MTLNEFKAWFDGFTEDMEGPPSDKQWKKIKARMKDVTGAATSYPVFVDRYVRPHWPHPWPDRYLQAYGSSGSALSSGNQQAAPINAFNLANAFYELGKDDAGAAQ